MHLNASGCVEENNENQRTTPVSFTIPNNSNPSKYWLSLFFVLVPLLPSVLSCCFSAANFFCFRSVNCWPCSRHKTHPGRRTINTILPCVPVCRCTTSSPFKIIFFSTTKSPIAGCKSNGINLEDGNQPCTSCIRSGIFIRSGTDEDEDIALVKDGDDINETANTDVKMMAEEDRWLLLGISIRGSLRASVDTNNKPIAIIWYATIVVVVVSVVPLRVR